MFPIQICPSKKFNHRKTHRLLSERTKEIISKCKKGQKAKLYQRRTVIHGKIPKYRRHAYHEHPSVNYENPYRKISLDYPRFNHHREYTPIPKKFFKNVTPEPVDLKYLPKKELYQYQGKDKDCIILLKEIHIENAIMSIFRFY
ncbi:hypothetical protein SteCoe_29706 [Stentor coeruleus]|uniref:Uncharacterized protein n=1 Tax=Stentor coeruleus TaxID=5963 RepID=A0A1R2B5R5_9CILI|nr:hypothetical protein SteCoe_29706 [Stentor coeruleus]